MPIQNWECPYCGHAQTVTDNKFDDRYSIIRAGDKHDEYFAIGRLAIICSNEECRKLYLHLTLNSRNSRDEVREDPIVTWQLLPNGIAKPQPSYIPQVLISDYNEACLIINNSPKASATLARRCIQGIIRDFFGISKSRLIDEINELRKQVESKQIVEITGEVIEAIDHVREIGNIGAHMEKDVNVIIDVEIDEAQILIELIETLFEDLYVARYKRQERLRKLKAVADNKDAAKKSAASAAAGGSAPPPQP
ncbi:DUF4145 domain-containing protein [Nitrospirillum sp. BR 11828]|uniref:DUF4145 domain-containing protein n=1 Tax=Nitrospirillum sp. BR 11828 TaxID=3104325 RepID=UPI002ACA0F52|nr:DUF4145 domain-containing protein [Nitrospirillum sp. BR 11828]MDZ5646375.1 DUF4145 domain-containing protein [Nitrospirillum sp. BR 11828]